LTIESAIVMSLMRIQPLRGQLGLLAGKETRDAPDPPHRHPHGRWRLPGINIVISAVGTWGSMVALEGDRIERVPIQSAVARFT